MQISMQCCYDTHKIVFVGNRFKAGLLCLNTAGIIIAVEVNDERRLLEFIVVGRREPTA